MQEMKATKILVIGATGNVGSAVTEQLAAMGNPCRALVRRADTISRFDADRVECVLGDLDKPETLEKAVSGVESIFLVTANTQQDRNVIEAAGKAGCRKIVKLSTLEAGWTPIKGHGQWHREREILIEESGLAWTFLRPTMMMNVALFWQQSVKSRNAVVYPGGSAVLPIIHPADVAAVAIAALVRREHDGKGFELTGGEPLSMSDMTEILAAVLDKPLTYVEQPDENFIEETMGFNIPRYAAEGFVETFKFVRAGDFAHSTDYVRATTGNNPRTFESWCRENVAAFK
jgi:uncharacterized protein YbjT (DUF2867 family)